MSALRIIQRRARWPKSFCTFLILLTSWSVASASGIDTSLATRINTELHAEKQLPLYFPRSVKRFYTARNFQSAWLIRKKGETGHAWQAMLLLDCVLQYGLSHADYHPDELRYDLLHDIFEQPDKISEDRQARFELMLTDAMLTLMDHLHYGKLNPELPAIRIDAGEGDTRMESVLSTALARTDISEALLSVQPKGQAYMEMQRWMHKWKGQYLDDCYEVPEENVRKVAINMERLRWAAIGDGPYVQIDIPSFTLTLFLPDSTYHFKVVTGSRATPTPLLQSAIYAVNVVPKTELPDQLRTLELLPQSTPQTGKAGSLLNFHFSSRNKIDLIEIKQTAWFKRNQRALSQGNIGVEKPEKLAALLLKADRQEGKIALLRRTRLAGNARTFRLQKPMPLKVTYLTCRFQDGQLVAYPDIYQLDTKLEQAIYHQLPTRPAGR